LTSLGFGSISPRTRQDMPSERCHLMVLVRDPYLVTYRGGNPALVHVAHHRSASPADRLLGGVPLCRLAVSRGAETSVELAARYRPAPTVRPWATCAGCGARIAEDPSLQDPRHLRLLEPTMRMALLAHRQALLNLSRPFVLGCLAEHQPIGRHKLLKMLEAAPVRLSLGTLGPDAFLDLMKNAKVVVEDSRGLSLTPLGRQFLEEVRHPALAAALAAVRPPGPANRPAVGGTETGIGQAA
jgi:hypothetical protein